LRLRPARRAALTMTLMSAECSMGPSFGSALKMRQGKD
jgi:hypothetical protein